LDAVPVSRPERQEGSYFVWQLSHRGEHLVVYLSIDVHTESVSGYPGRPQASGELCRLILLLVAVVVVVVEVVVVEVVVVVVIYYCIYRFCIVY